LIKYLKSLFKIKTAWNERRDYIINAEIKAGIRDKSGILKSDQVGYEFERDNHHLLF